MAREMLLDMRACRLDVSRHRADGLTSRQTHRADLLPDHGGHELGALDRNTGFRLAIDSKNAKPCPTSGSGSTGAGRAEANHEHVDCQLPPHAAHALFAPDSPPTLIEQHA